MVFGDFKRRDWWKVGLVLVVIVVIDDVLSWL
nr:MAG TPA: hypothetical protein [Caudoviricetes sp.]